MKIVFFGTPEFAVASLDALVKSGVDVAAVVTMPDKTGGRGNKVIESDVKKYAVANGLPLLQPEKLRDPRFIAALREIDADLFVVIAFRMMPEVVWSMPRYGTFNLHGSLLPKFRGAAPINHAIINGEEVTGVTTFFLNKDIDTGDIIDRVEIPVEHNDDAGTIHDKLMAIGAELTLKTVRAIEEGTLQTHPQPEGEYVPAPKIFKDFCEINWNRSAKEIRNHIRGLSPYPGACSKVRYENGKPADLKIFSTELTDRNSGEHKPGEVLIEGKRLYVATSDNLLEILQLQPSGKKRMDTAAFLLGYHPAFFGE